MNKNLKVAALFVGFSLLLSACGSSGGNPGGTTPPASNFGSTYTRNITVLNWPMGKTADFSDDTLTINLNASGTGTIMLASKTTPSSETNSLSTILENILGCPANAFMMTGDTNSYNSFYAFRDKNNDGTYIYQVALATADTKYDVAKKATVHSAGGKDGRFFFVTQNFTLKGTASCSNGVQATYDVTLTPGWNLVTVADIDGTHWTVKNDVETGLDWRSIPLLNNVPSTTMSVGSQGIQGDSSEHSASY